MLSCEKNEMLLKEVSKESGMNKCPKCESIEVINKITNLTQNFGMNVVYKVDTHCEACKNTWGCNIEIPRSLFLKIRNKYKDNYDFYRDIMIRILCAAREQMELFVGHDANKIIVEQKEEN